MDNPPGPKFRTKSQVMPSLEAKHFCKGGKLRHVASLDSRYMADSVCSSVESVEMCLLHWRKHHQISLTTNKQERQRIAQQSDRA